MSHSSQRILLLYMDPHYRVHPVYPFGLDLIADELSRCGHTVTVASPFLPDADTRVNLTEAISESRPDLIGLGIRNIDTAMSCEPFGNVCTDTYRARYFLPEIRAVTETIRQLAPDVPMVAGGGAFTVAPAALLDYLGLDYGIVGPGDVAMCRFARALRSSASPDGIPGLVRRQGARFIDHPAEAFAFQPGRYIRRRSSQFAYAWTRSGMPVQLKRGCNQRCSYCVEPIIEGRRFVFRDADDVFSELQQIARRHDAVQTIFFTDTEFNLPDTVHGSRVLGRIRDSELNGRFRFASQFLPKPFDADLARLLASVDCAVILTCDSFSDRVLAANGASYRRSDIVSALELCRSHDLDCTVNLIFGLPGETRRTLDRTVEMIHRYPTGARRRYEYTVGGRIYAGTPLCRWAEKKRSEADADGWYGPRSPGYLAPCYYCAPWHPTAVKERVKSGLSGAGVVQAGRDPASGAPLPVAYLADCGRWTAAAAAFDGSRLAARVDIFDYLFRKLADAGRLDLARSVCGNLMRDLSGANGQGLYADTMALAGHYFSLLPADGDSVP